MSIALVLKELMILFKGSKLQLYRAKLLKLVHIYNNNFYKKNNKKKNEGGHCPLVEHGSIPNPSFNVAP